MPSLSWGLTVIGLTSVAAMGRQVVIMAVSNPIPHNKRVELEDKYGHWAVETAIAVCPHDDIKCIEREAKRLYEVRVMRR